MIPDLAVLNGHVCPPHWWLFEDSRGEFSKGVCKFCQAVTIQPNIFLVTKRDFMVSERWEAIRFTKGAKRYVSATT